VTPTPIRVLLATTWATTCGIAEHSALLVEAVTAADPAIEILPEPSALDPAWVVENLHPGIDLLHVNAQAALHSRWTPDAIRLVQSADCPVLVTWHDTGVPNSDQCKAVVDAADAAVVHEPCDDLPAEKTRYWRMGVPDWQPVYDFETHRRPLLGSIGFPFPWKCFDQLAEVTARAGWDLLLITPTATPEQERQWKTRNPQTSVCSTFLPRHLAVSWLSGCDATAFCYVCHNTGQSGAILQGIAARKPVFALSTCRQFRSLYLDPLGRQAIRWVETFEALEAGLRTVPIQRVDPATVALAEQESWTRLGVRYAGLYRSLAEAR